VKRRQAPVRIAAPLARLAAGPVPEASGTAGPMPQRGRGPARLSALHRGVSRSRAALFRGHRPLSAKLLAAGR